MCKLSSLHEIIKKQRLKLSTITYHQINDFLVHNACNEITTYLTPLAEVPHTVQCEDINALTKESRCIVANDVS